MGTPSETGAPLVVPQGNNRVFLQALDDLYYGEVERTHFHRYAMQGAAGDHVDIIASTLDVQCLTGNGQRVVHLMGGDRDHNIGVRQKHSIRVFDAH